MIFSYSLACLTFLLGKYCNKYIYWYIEQKKDAVSSSNDVATNSVDSTNYNVIDLEASLTPMGRGGGGD